MWIEHPLWSFDCAYIIRNYVSNYNHVIRNVGEDREVTVNYLLLGIWEQKESAGHQIMAGLGFNDEKAKELEKSVCLSQFFENSLVINQLNVLFCVFFENLF